MFNGIKVWRLCRLVQKLDLLFFKSDLGSPRGVLGIIIWLKDNVTFWNSRILHDLQQPLLQNGHYLLAPITRDHRMLKSPHSLDPLTSWVTCVLLCTSCPPHVGLTDHTWRAAFHMFASCPTHVRSLASPFPHGRLPCHIMAVLIHQSSSCMTHGRVM
jgi:hypothetical protein